MSLVSALLTQQQRCGIRGSHLTTYSRKLGGFWPEVLESAMYVENWAGINIDIERENIIAEEASPS